MHDQERREALRRLAAELEGIDREVYLAAGRDPLEPIIGAGNPDARIALFGRDPGRDEVVHQLPFVGAGGQKVRTTLYQHLYGAPMPDFDASIAVGRYLYWANTVPYKPIGNKAWSMQAKRRFQPLVADLLIHAWRGADVITLGREAFLWFGLALDRSGRQRLDAFWGDEAQRFVDHCEVTLGAPDGAARTLRLHPLPHPSPLNATWYARFPALLAQRLARLELTLDHWKREP